MLAWSMTPEVDLLQSVVVDLDHGLNMILHVPQRCHLTHNEIGQYYGVVQ